MNTIKIIKTLLFISILLMTASCNNYLDVKPSSQLDRTDLFSSEKGYADALTGVYANMSGASLYGRELTWRMLDILGGYYSGPYYGLNMNFRDYPYKQNNVSKDDNVIAKIDSVWYKMYTQIANLNSVLETIDGNKNIFSNDNYRIIKGEALGLRAFLHFELLRMYGQPYSIGKDVKAIPYVTTLSTTVTPLMTVDQSLTIIVADLKEAQSLMVNDPIKLGTTPSSVLASIPTGAYSKYNIPIWHNRRFRFNYYATIATLARVYQWKGDKVNALACAKEIIAVQNDKFPWVSTSNLTTIGTSSANQDKTFATEQIFALNSSKLLNYQDGFSYDGSVDLFTSNDIMVADRSYYENNTGDPRYQYMFSPVNYYYVLTKFIQNDNVLDVFQKRMPMIRISEMYYIAAESEPDFATAVGYLNSVRSHRGLSDKALDPTKISQSDLTNEIEKEYQKEFFGEGQLWYYYKRNLATTIQNMWNFSDTSLYTFDRPETEDLYGGR